MQGREVSGTIRKCEKGTDGMWTDILTEAFEDPRAWGCQLKLMSHLEPLNILNMTRLS